MKLASLKKGGRDGTLIVVDRKLQFALEVPEIALTLQHAIENWEILAPRLTAVYEALNTQKIKGTPLTIALLASPLPRAFQWLDGSAYLPHVERVRKARGANMPESFLTDPLMYQGGSDGFLGPHDPITVQNENWGLDFESEVAIITDDVPEGISPQRAGEHIKLFMLVNDVSLRNLIPQELSKGFGFLQGKPASTFSPVAITADELGPAWDGGKVRLPLNTYFNNNLFGNPDAGKDMQFDFPTLISHAAKTRQLCAGTIIGSGTVSNIDTGRGCSCLAEKRVLEIIETGEALTPFMRQGDCVRIEMHDATGQSLFGAIKQEVLLCRN